MDWSFGAGEGFLAADLKDILLATEAWDDEGASGLKSSMTAITCKPGLTATSAGAPAGSLTATAVRGQAPALEAGGSRAS